MKKFLYKIIVFVILVIIILALCVLFHYYVIGNQYERGYNASINDKIALLKITNEPKIILIGNSNLSFGINSEILSKELNMPVVNLGLHGGLGNKFHEDMAFFNVKKGDILVVAHNSYEDNGKISDYGLAWVTLEWHKELWRIIPKEEYLNMLKSYPRFFTGAFLLWIKSKGNRYTSNSYSRNAFNVYGDVAYKPYSGKMNIDEFFKIKKNNASIPQINDICIDRLNKLNEKVKNKGAYLVVAGYPINYGSYSRYKIEDFDAFEYSLKARLKCDVISNYRDYIMPYSLFYDTTLHLNEEGARIRTRILVKDLKKWKQGNYFLQ